jgi:hypothetical protein
MLVAALNPMDAMSAQLLLGSETPSYQNNDSKFQKIFATFSNLTMTGLIVDFSNNTIQDLSVFEECVLNTIQTNGKRINKRAVPNLMNETEKITFFQEGNCPNCYKLLKIVGVWDTQEEFGLVYKFIDSERLAI